MKKLLIATLILFCFCSCKKNFSPFNNPNNNFYGNWEITKYEVNGENLISKSNFTRNNLIIRENSYTPYSYGGASSGFYCNDTTLLFNIDLDLDNSKVTFEANGHCNHPDVIDPLYFYKGNVLQNEWHLKSFSRKIMILTNSTNDQDDEIKVLFEKLKDKNYDR